MLRPFDILFLGSDLFSVDVLKAVYRRKHLYSSLSVVTPPPARTGRGLRQLRIPPLLELSEKLQLQTYTPSAADLSQIGSQLYIPPNIILTASYGHLLPSALLDIVPPKHAINVHPSLLPKLRGAAPIQWAIARRLQESGVSIQTMQNDVFDSGKILLQRRYGIGHKPTYSSLSKDLGPIAGEAAADVLENFEEYKLNSFEQDIERITHAPKMHRKIGFVDFSKMSAEVIESRHRAFSHQRPLSAALVHSKATHQLVDIEAITGVIFEGLTSANEGSATLIGNDLIIKCAKTSYLRVKSLKPPGKRTISAHEWWNGYRHKLDIVNFTKPSL